MRKQSFSRHEARNPESIGRLDIGHSDGHIGEG
jgi:hypothetical protein